MPPVRFTAGAAAAVLLSLAAGEAFLCGFPPADFRPYLGELSGLGGPFRADERSFVRYRSWQAFEDEHPGRPTRIDSPRCWAMFGNSFVQAPGMLADTTRATLPDRPVFNLGRNVDLVVAGAQIELLLEHGVKPERIFYILLPHDAGVFARRSLSRLRVTPKGGIVYAPRDPGGPAGWAIRHSHLALMAWVRSGRHDAVPRFRDRTLVQGIHPALHADLRRLLANLGDVSRRHGVPVTVVLIPNYEQITRGAPFGMQDDLTPTCRACGLDVCDVRRAFLEADDKAGLFIPDKHFSERGNRILLAAILAHLGEGREPVARVEQGGRP